MAKLTIEDKIKNILFFYFRYDIIFLNTNGEKYDKDLWKELYI